MAIFKDKKNAPTGFALGSVEGRVAIQYINPTNPYVSNSCSHLQLNRNMTEILLRMKNIVESLILNDDFVLSRRYSNSYT